MRVIEEFGYCQLATKKGLKFRISLVEKLFEDCSRENASDPTKPPLSYQEVKQMLQVGRMLFEDWGCKLFFVDRTSW